MSKELQDQLDLTNKAVQDINTYTNDLASDLESIIKLNEELIGKLEAGDADVTTQIKAVNVALTERAESLKALASRVTLPPPPTPIETITNPQA